MTLGQYAAVAALAIPVFGVLFAGAWEIDDYEREHKPMAQAMWAWVEFDKCLRACEDDQLAVCTAVGIKPEDCPIDCSRCDRYKESK